MKLLLGSLVILSCTNVSIGQVLTRRPPETYSSSAHAATPVQQAVTVPLIVPVGTPLKIALNREIRIRKAGQPVRGSVVEPVYAFDKLVIPAGTSATGTISAISSLSNKSRTLAAMNANFSPARQVRITFQELQLPDGTRIPIHTSVSPGSAGVLQFVVANTKRSSRTEATRNAVSRRISAAKQELRKEWDLAKLQMEQPGKLHRLERLGMMQLPYHPQYIDAGTTFNAELQQPLTFAEESLTTGQLSAIGTAPTSAAVLHAELTTPLSSAISRKGDAVEAVITEPLYSSNRLLFPEGSRIEGTVVQVRSARHLARNGLLRIQFQQIVPPNGIAQKIEASLDAVETGQSEHLALDSEGGAEVVTPKTRYFTTALSVALAASSVSPEHDHDGDLHAGADPGNGAATGASGLKLVGMVAGSLAHSRVISSGLGFYGAGMSVYSHFLARGREVVYPKDTSMLVGLGAGRALPTAADKTRP